MLRRWGILTAMLTLMAGLTLATGSASASTGTMSISPGGPIHLSQRERLFTSFTC